MNMDVTVSTFPTFVHVRTLSSLVSRSTSASTVGVQHFENCLRMVCGFGEQLPRVSKVDIEWK